MPAPVTARNPRRSAIALAACAFALPPIAGDAPVYIQLTPAGEFRPNDSRLLPVKTWRIDAAIASQVIARFNARATPVVIDYEHQTLKKDSNGQPAPAAGWMRALQWRDGVGLFAEAVLTQRARDFIAAGEILYVSPVFQFDRETGDVLSIDMAALTNTPALDNMAPLSLSAAASFGCIANDEDQNMPNKLLTAICAALALADTTTEDAAVAALSQLPDQLDELTKLRVALGVAADQSALAACAALQSASQSADPAKYVPIAQFETVKQQLAALSSKDLARDVGALVDAGLANGRLLPAQKEWAVSLGKSNLAALSQYLDATAPIAALSGTQTSGRLSQAAGGHSLTDIEQAVCAATGVSAEAFLAAASASAGSIAA